MVAKVRGSSGRYHASRSHGGAAYEPPSEVLGIAGRHELSGPGDGRFRHLPYIIKSKNCKLYGINGVEDHIHIFSDLHPGISLSDYVKDIKVASSIWIKESGKFPHFKAWQEGCGAFTYSIREKDVIINYIKNQKNHHKKETFYDEFKKILVENGVEFDEKYLL